MNDFIQSVFVNPPPGSVRDQPDPLLAVRRSFGEGDPASPDAPRRVRWRRSFRASSNRAGARAKATGGTRA